MCIARHPQLSVLIVCSGSLDRFNLEDFHGAGHLIAHFARRGDYAMTDAAIAALHAYRGCDSRTALGSFAGRPHDDRRTTSAPRSTTPAEHDSLDVVPVLIDGQLVRAAA